MGNPVPSGRFDCEGYKRLRRRKKRCEEWRKEEDSVRRRMRMSSTREKKWKGKDRGDDRPKPGMVCAECGKPFAKRSNWRAHQRVHTDERPFVCDVCGESYKWQSSLTAHGKGHERKAAKQRRWLLEISRTNETLDRTQLPINVAERHSEEHREGSASRFSTSPPAGHAPPRLFDSEIGHLVEPLPPNPLGPSRRIEDEVQTDPESRIDMDSFRGIDQLLTDEELHAVLRADFSE